MTIAEAIEQLRAHWGEIHIDVGVSGAAVVANQSTARRAYSGSHNGALKVYEQPSLALALTVAVHGEGLAP